MQLFFISPVGLLELICQHLVLVFDIVNNERLFLNDRKLLPQVFYLNLFFCQVVSLARSDKWVIFSERLLLDLLQIVDRPGDICLRSCSFRLASSLSG